MCTQRKHDHSKTVPTLRATSWWRACSKATLYFEKHRQHVREDFASTRVSFLSCQQMATHSHKIWGIQQTAKRKGVGFREGKKEITKQLCPRKHQHKNHRSIFSEHMSASVRFNFKGPPRPTTPLRASTSYPSVLKCLGNVLYEHMFQPKYNGQFQINCFIAQALIEHGQTGSFPSVDPPPS